MVFCPLRNLIAHLPGSDTCIGGYQFMYYSCKNSSWMIDIDGSPYAPVDQIYCYTNDESQYSTHSKTAKVYIDHLHLYESF